MPARVTRDHRRYLSSGCSSTVPVAADISGVLRPNLAARLRAKNVTCGNLTTIKRDVPEATELGAPSGLISFVGSLLWRPTRHCTLAAGEGQSAPLEQKSSRTQRGKVETYAHHH